MISSMQQAAAKLENVQKGASNILTGLDAPSVL